MRTFPLDQIVSLGDYSGLENLHVYGDLLCLYSLPVHATIEEAESLFRSIRSLDLRILTVYVSYVLARAGFSAAKAVEIDTTEFEDHDWLKHLYLFEHHAEWEGNEWVHGFDNKKNERIGILFVTLLWSDNEPNTGKSSEAGYLLGLLDELACNYVVVHPRLSRKIKKIFMRTKERVKQIRGQDIVLSTGEFVSNFIPDEGKRKIVEANWEVLREKILRGMLQKEWPILVYSIHDQLISDIRERLEKTRLKFGLGRDMEESIKDAGIACEGLLQILHSIYPKKFGEKMEFYDLLCNLKEIIIEEFGQDIYDDLDLIREWRNKVLHPPVTKPDVRTTLKIITKAELFHELFHEKIIKNSHRKS